MKTSLQVWTKIDLMDGMKICLKGGLKVMIKVVGIFLQGNIGQ